MHQIILAGQYIPYKSNISLKKEPILKVFALLYLSNILHFNTEYDVVICLCPRNHYCL